MINLGSFMPIETVLKLVKKSLVDFFKRDIKEYRLIVNILARKVDFEVDKKLYKFADGEKFIDAINNLISNQQKITEKIDLIIVNYKDKEKTTLEIYATSVIGEKIKLTKTI